MSSHYLNMYEFVNLGDFEHKYRYLKVTGLPWNDSYYKNLNILVKKLAYSLKKPVTLVEHDHEHYIVIPDESPLPILEQSLIPYVATLVPLDKAVNIHFGSLDEETLPIVVSFLRYAINGKLMRDRSVWSSGNSHFQKEPINGGMSRGEIDIFGGFKYRVIPLESRKLFLCVDLAYRYIERDWLTKHLDRQPIEYFKMKHFLYCFGEQFYRVQLLGGTGLSIKDQKFQPDYSTSPIDVYSYTKHKWADKQIAHIDSLDENSPAILYRYPGSNKEAYGAADLCKLILLTDDIRVRPLHSQSIRSPSNRFQEIGRIISRYFQNIRFGDERILLSDNALSGSKKYFNVPDQLMGHNNIIHIKRHENDTGIPLASLGRTRMNNLLNPRIGSIGNTDFDAQYVFLPLSLDRDIGRDFCNRIKESLKNVYHHQYNMTIISYDDRDARTLEKQVQSILTAVAENGVSHGYSLLILPVDSQADLHNYIKKQLWPDIQCQCASAESLKRYYQKHGDSWSLRQDILSRYTSYLRYLALGVLIVNRKWISALDSPQRYDTYIGVDVLNRMAGFTYVYQGGRKVYFRSYPTQQKEKLSARNLRKVLQEDLERDIRDLGLSPKHIVIHRDGLTFATEIRGLHEAVNNLKAGGVLEHDVLVGVVEIHKQSAYPLRMAEVNGENALKNPRVGSWFRLSEKDGIVCNTGAPFLTQGTANPLYVRIVDGNLEIEKVLEDVFALSNLAWAAPDKCQRLPITIKLGDTFLRPIASPSDFDRAIYGEEDGENNTADLEADEENKDVEQPIGAD